MGCFKYCSLKTVADRMTGAIFILVREQGTLWGVNQRLLSHPYKECNCEEKSEKDGPGLLVMTFALCGRFSTSRTLQRSHLGRECHANCTAGETFPELMHSLTDSYDFYMASDLNDLVSPVGNIIFFLILKSCNLLLNQGGNQSDFKVRGYYVNTVLNIQQILE